MKDGLYRIQFNTPRGRNTGVLHVVHEKAYGGDASLFYTGSIKTTGSLVTVDLTVGRHTEFPGIESPFGADQVKVALQGTLDGGHATCVGSVTDRPDFAFNAVLTPIRN